MAKIKFSALVSDVRNKLNGSVMSKNRYGSYMRNKTTPVNPQTTFQQNVRAQLAANSQAWGGLTEAQRSGWRALAAELPFTDIFGDSKILAGNSLYNKLNGNLNKIGEASISEAPVKISVPSLLTFSVAAVAAVDVLTSLNLTFTPTAIPAGYSLVVYATPGISPGRNFVKNQFRLVTAIAETTASPVNIFTAYSARFGAPAEDMKIFVRVALVSNDTGQQGIPLEAVAVVTV
jgi:hypothetical protein